MSYGPIIIYDKSALQRLNADEAFCLECHYRANIVPLFYVEVLADLDKQVAPDRRAEDLVRSIAAKVTGLGAVPNVHHTTLCIGDLLGYAVEQSGVPVIGGGKVVQSVDGRKGLFFDEPPETAAMRRWGKGDFLGVERDFAKGWRESLRQLPLDQIAAAIRPSGKSPLRSLADVKAAADEMAEGRGRRYRSLKLAMMLLGVPPRLHAAIVARWKACGGPPIREFAPYAHYVFRVELFFYLGMASGQIASTRPSHRIDISYLHYLPFCNVFTSADRLHASLAPLFLSSDQVFVEGDDLKADMRALAARYAALSPEERAKGAMKYAAYPPRDGYFLTSKLFDRFFPGWRTHAESPIEVTPEISERVMKELKPMIDAFEASERSA